MERSFDFSIVRICPDARRGEIINIGICVYLEDRLDVRVLPSMRKAQALHGEIDIQSLYELPDHLNGWISDIKSTKERYELLREFGMIMLSEPGLFLADESEYETTVSELMAKLVE